MFFERIMSLLITLALCAAPLTTYAGDSSLTAEQPAVEAFRTALNKETSTLNIPIEMSTDDLAKILNATVGKELYKGSTKTKGMSADVFRNGPMSLSAADNFIFISLPVTISLSYSMFETNPIPLKLKFKVTASVTPDWRIHADVFYLGVSDLLAEEVGLGPLSFKPRSVVDGITQPVQRILSAMVEKKLNELLPLKTQVAKVWTTAQAPILLDRTYKTWLRMSPQEIVISPLYAQNNRVKLSAGVSTFAELVIGPEPAAQPVRPLPSLKLVNRFDKTFRIALNADVFYGDLIKIAAPLLLNRQFDSGGNSVTIRDFDLSGNGEKLVVKLVTAGSLNGVVYLTAKPVFNPKTNLFSVEDVDFDMKTESMLLKSADWFLHGSIRSFIQEQLNMNLSRQLEQSRQIAATALTRMKLMEHLYLKSDIKELKLKDVIVQKDRVSIQVFTDGESAILFQ